MRKELFEDFVFVDCFFVVVDLVVFGGPLFIVDVLVEHSSDQNWPRSENEIVKGDIVILENSLAGKGIVATVEKLGHRKSNVFVVEILDHFGHANVRPATMHK